MPQTNLNVTPESLGSFAEVVGDLTNRSFDSVPFLDPLPGGAGGQAELDVAAVEDGHHAAGANVGRDVHRFGPSFHLIVQKKDQLELKNGKLCSSGVRKLKGTQYWPPG